MWMIGRCSTGTATSKGLIGTRALTSGGGLFSAELPAEVPAEFSEELLLEFPGVASATPFTSPSGTRAAFFVVRLVGRTVHFRFRPAHRLQGNFLSHLVLVLAQLEHAIGVRPADFGTIPWEGGRGSRF